MNIVDRMVGVENTINLIVDHYNLTKKGVKKMKSIVEIYVDNYKTCNQCKEIKHVDEFNWLNKEKGKRYARCKKCLNEYRRGYTKNNKDKISEYKKRYYQNHRSERLEYQKRYDMTRGDQ